MKSVLHRFWLPMLLAVVLAGCAGMKEASQPLTFTPATFEAGKYLAKADNFQLVIDASMTMGADDQKNLMSAKNFTSAVNQSLPADFTANMGLRSFGHSDKQSSKPTELLYGVEKYSRSGMQAGLDKLKYAGGTSPMGAAINAAGADFEKAGGSGTLVIVSDGTQNVMDDAIASIAALKAKMGDKLCVYTVWVGDDAVGQKYLDKVAAAGGCGAAYTGAALTDQKAMADFVDKVFLKLKPIPPAPVVAPTPPPPPAPAPPPPAPMMKKEVITFNLLFDFDKSDIKDEFIPVLEQAKKILDEDPTATYIIAGHTDWTGTDAYNQKLSERRAASVKKWLVQHGIAADRMETIGYGESQPKYDNKTKEGRKLNRRVEIMTK